MKITLQWTSNVTGSQGVSASVFIDTRYCVKFTVSWYEELSLDVLSSKRLSLITSLKVGLGESLVGQWLGLRALIAKGWGSIPGWGTKIPQRRWHGQKKKKVGLKSLSHHFFFNVFILFIYFWLHWIFVAARGLSLVVASGGSSSLQCAGFSLRWLLLLRSTGSRRTGFSSCGSWTQ